VRVRRRAGFTLIELLVVIAIIAILAAMLFPVFARARESARKIQCLSNVKNITTALQVYLSDYDRFPPSTTDSAAIEMMEDLAPWWAYVPGCEGANWANPWVRWPVVLDAYIGNRDIWSCPSAKREDYTGVIIPSSYPGGYTQAWRDYGFGPIYPCYNSWPSGWGGTTTDSFTQLVLGTSGPGAFHMSIGCNLSAIGLSPARIEDPSWFVCFGDSGPWATWDLWVSYLATPDACKYVPMLICAPDGPSYPGYWELCLADWTNCPWSVDCSLSVADKHTLADSAVKKGGRHLGGSNIGFADGHAAWMPARQIFAESPRYSQGGFLGALVPRKLKGLSMGNLPTTAAGDPAAGVVEGTWPAGCGGSDPTPLY